MSQSRRSVIVSWLILLCAGGVTRAEVTSDELLRAARGMSPEQAHAFTRELEAKQWKPVPQGFFRRMAVDIGVSYSALDSVDLSSVSLSGGDMDVDQVSGLDIGLLWQVFCDRLRLGLRMGSWESTDSNLEETGYSRADLTGGNLSFAVNYQWVRSESWLLWTDIAPGVGSVEIETVDTPTGHATTLRSFDATYGLIDIEAGASLLANPVLTLFVSGGYRLAESVDLDEGGTTSKVEIYASGFRARVGLGFNF